MADETASSAGGGGNHEISIFVDAVKYKVTKTSMTGAEIKALAGRDAQYQLYLEETGDQPDKAVGDTESLALRNDMHFYAIPPTTFGNVHIKA
jgi:hypothetical protein